jgi:hypothetical protein
MAATAVSENPQEQQNGKSLFDRIQQPGVSNQMAHQISLLEHEFNMVELQQCMLLPHTSSLSIPHPLFTLIVEVISLVTSQNKDHSLQPLEKTLHKNH